MKDYEDTIRRLLSAVRGGERAAFEALIETVGHELRKLSAYRLRQQAPGHTLQTTALVNEVVLKLIQMLNNPASEFPASREHFLALASRMMRFTLADYARRRKLQTVSLDDGSFEPRSFASADGGPLTDWSERDLDTLLAIDEGLKQIEQTSADYGKRRSAALELFLFGGMNYREIAAELGTTDDTARRDCQLGLARLRELFAHPDAGGGAALER
jgi:RNA polymerase sigma factor (TIGR02999 family)